MRGGEETGETGKGGQKWDRGGRERENNDKANGTKCKQLSVKEDAYGSSCQIQIKSLKVKKNI